MNVVIPIIVPASCIERVSGFHAGQKELIATKQSRANSALGEDTEHWKSKVARVHRTGKERTAERKNPRNLQRITFNYLAES